MLGMQLPSALVLLVLLLASNSGPAPTPFPNPSPAPTAAETLSNMRATTDRGDAVKLTGTQSERREGSSHSPSRRSGSSGSSLSATGSAAQGERYCDPILYTEGKYREVIFECDGAGGTERTPWFERSDTTGGDEPPTVTREVVTLSREDVQRLIVAPGNLIVQPDRPWVLVNTDTVVMTDAAEHILSTRVLDLDIDVRVTPVLYTWDFGDGSAPLMGTDPGAPWPNHTVSHVYGEAGTVTISLRTEWDAAFRVEGTSTWIPVTGRAVTTQGTEAIEVVTATPRLTTGG